MRLFSTKEYEPEFWRIVGAVAPESIRRFLALNAFFLIYVIAMRILIASHPEETQRYLASVREWLRWFEPVVPYLEGTVWEVATGRYIYRVDFVRHVLTAFWLQIYLSLAIAALSLTRVVPAVADRLGTTEVMRREVRSSLGYSPLLVGVMWLVWANLPTSVSAGFSVRSLTLDQSVLGAMFFSVMAFGTAGHVTFAVIHALVVRRWKSRPIPNPTM